MKAVWTELMADSRQIFMIVSGHVVRPSGQADSMIPRTHHPPVIGAMRNYQTASLAQIPSQHYGVGWNVVAVFDPEASQVRIRSYRIDDVAAYSDPPANFAHTAAPAPTECFDMDFESVTERIVPFDFEATPWAPLPHARLGVVGAYPEVDEVVVVEDSDFDLLTRDAFGAGRSRGHGRRQRAEQAERGAVQARVPSAWGETGTTGRRAGSNSSRR